MPAALIIAGPTGSGKSALALALAERLGGVVINADSMQVYRELRVVTARPGPADEARVPHALYGVRAAAEPGNAGWWRDAALEAMEAARAAGRLPILCGGTGLYLSALTQGIAPVPGIADAPRQEARGLLAELGAAGLHARLAQDDPETALRLRPNDGQRLARAWEVWRATGRGLAAWQREAAAPPGWRFRMVLLDPPRPELRQRLAARFGAMLAEGAVAEVQALLALNLDPALPLLRAVGVPELAAHIRGVCSLEEAAARSVLASGQYAKRQTTWFRNRGIADPHEMHTISAIFRADAQFSESNLAEIAGFVSRSG